MNTIMLSALAESNRLQIVELLCSGPLTVGEVADRLHIRQPQASKHLKVLLEAGLVEVEADANRRIYKLRLEPFKELNAWLEGYRDIWENRFDNLNHYLQQLFQKEQKQEE
ncbi:metalloregulator ArsR/SmtB family transcription factor [Paenibacillus sp. GD4]|uniref:ArsR/SmtB family transcription factor n=1 Tax=Paenibacillus sp. GD4 TaxID=3068890 RepID=UPI002796D1AF|nr:metalloregulator ArsR/SmtB family transcription factor [Paenibacillus sp. GD4]MDQ1910788.1 metalloregulator ArsR/SmtB family transcription factor [Paenibacillus sp. GD4]